MSGNNNAPMDPIQAAAQAFVTGGDVAKAVYGNQVPEDLKDSYPDESSQESDTQEVSQEETSEESQELSSGEETSEEQAPEKKPDIEELIVSDESGRKKLKVDWNNREQIKKYISMAAGMRKFQAERDKYKSQLDKVSPEHKEYKDSWTALQKAYEDEGVAGIINLVTGQKDGHEKYVQKELQRRQLREDASPAELERMELQEMLEKERKQREKDRKQVEELLAKASTSEKEANKKELQSMVNPVFEKYRFAGKLGNPEAEVRIDRAIWRDAMDAFEELPDDVDVTPELMHKLFRDSAQSYRSIIKQEAEKNSKKVIDSKKVAAKEKVLKTVNTGVKSDAAREEFDKNIKGGDWHSAVRNLLTGKIKL